MSFERTRLWMALIGIASCTLEGGKDVPPVTADGPLVVDPTTQKVSLDIAQVPVLPSCAVGQVVRRAASGWECTAVGALPVSWSSILDKPTSTDWSAITGITSATAWPGTIPLARIEGATDLTASLNGRVAALEQRTAQLEAATDDLTRQLRALRATEDAKSDIFAFFQASTGPGVLVFGYQGSPAAPGGAVNYYLEPGSGSSSSLAAQELAVVLPSNGKLARLNVRAQSGPGTAQVGINVWKNGISTNLSTALTVGQNTGSDLTNVVTCTAGDRIAVELAVPAGVSPMPTNLYATLQFTLE